MARKWHAQLELVNQRQAIAGIYGLASAKKMAEIENSDLDFEIWWFCLIAGINTCHRNYISLFINGRYIKTSYSIELFRYVLMAWAFSTSHVIHIHIDPYLADVNVQSNQARGNEFPRKESWYAGFRSYRKESQGTGIDLDFHAWKILPNSHCSQSWKVS